MDPEDELMSDEDMTHIEWYEWEKEARQQEPIFLEAMNHHELVKNQPGIEIIRITEPNNGY